MSTAAIFWMNDLNDRNNFMCGVLTDGYPILPNESCNGMNINECRTITSLKIFINKWEKEYMEYLNRKLARAIDSDDEFSIRFYSQVLNNKYIIWSIDEYDKTGKIPDYNYVLKNGTIYVLEGLSGYELPIEDYFITKLSEDNKNLTIKACDNCLVKVLCTRSLEEITLCNDAYNEVKQYVHTELKVVN